MVLGSIQPLTEMNTMDNMLIRQYIPYYIIWWYYIIFNMFHLSYRHHQRSDFPH
jgi:hypothetical protein